MCDEGRPDDSGGGLRFFAGETADAYLQRSAPCAGYAIVVWRGRHVPDVSEMEPSEVTAFWSEALEVARAVAAVFEPCHLNYELLGNLVPHVHTHIVPRYLHDASPNAPLKPWVPVTVPEEELHSQVVRLREAVKVAG
jgi:diadenosine tetraphosphate (Ap4A) HIT family hydrolase